MSLRANIFSAAEDGTVEDVKYFIEKEGVNVNMRTDDKPQPINGETALHIAAYKGNIEIVKYLISKGADVNAKSDIGATPLHEAATDTGHTEHDTGKLEVAKLLISEGADVNAAEYSHGLTPLNLANAGRTRTEMRKYIESAGGFCKTSGEGKASSEVTLESVGKFLKNYWYLILGVIIIIISKDIAMGIIITIILGIVSAIIKAISKKINGDTDWD